VAIKVQQVPLRGSMIFLRLACPFTGHSFFAIYLVPLVNTGPDLDGFDVLPVHRRPPSARIHFESDVQS
jgi:hypothetical protein